MAFWMPDVLLQLGRPRGFITCRNIYCFPKPLFLFEVKVTAVVPVGGIMAPLDIDPNPLDRCLIS